MEAAQVHSAVMRMLKRIKRFTITKDFRISHPL
jgi:hypothetical protein